MVQADTTECSEDYKIGVGEALTELLASKKSDYMHYP